MNKKMSKRQKNIKTKLMAAICMLLVSSIMMVSTTYAWFTLSTAPEVTGIQTAVGANGNLEMALVPVNGNNKNQTEDYGITTGTSDSMANQAANLANVTWGNLVDLKTYYGLEGVTLYPSEINATMKEGTQIPEYILSGGSILKTPTYGADGRVSSVTANTVSGIYDTVQGKAFETVMDGTNPVANPAGVRLIGTVSGMSDRQLDFRNALSQASAAANSAQGAARGALEANGTALGNIAVKYATSSTKPYTDEDKNALVAMANGLEIALNHVETGLRHYIYAYQMSKSADEDDYLTYKARIFGDTTATPAVAASTLEQLLTDGTAPASMQAMIQKLADSRDELDDAQTKLGQLSGGSYQWADLSAAMSSLVNIQGMKINGTPVTTDGKITDGLKQKISDDFLDGKGITLTMPTGSGVFADVADFAGNYGATIGVPASAVIEGSTKIINASMVTAAIDDTYFEQAKDIASETPINAATGATQAISDFYGYVIDLAFRTNAADSFLKLQTTAVDRIYNGDGATPNEDTMGGGATMIFQSNDPTNGFQEDEMKALMKHIRVIFYDPTDLSGNKVLAFGVLDESTWTPLGNYEVSVGLKLATTPTPTQDSDYIANNVIMALEQNKAQRLSVLVYLDGTTVRNADVAVGAATSMTGRLNLQFSSSVELEPMKYTDFEDLDFTPDGGNTPATPTAKDYADGEFTISTGYAASNVKYGSYQGNTGIGAVITKDGAAVTEGVTVTIDGVAANYINGAWVAATTKTTAPESVAIVVTPTT